MRLGLFVNSSRGHRQAVEYCAAVRPAIMKWLEPDPAIIAECRRVSPGTKHIGRLVWSDQTLAAYPAFQAATLSWAQGRGLDYVEGYNEWGDRSRLRDFIRLEVGLAKRLNEAGIGAAIGGFSTGFLDEREGWRDLMAAWEYMQEVGPGRCILHGHEYSGPYMQYMTETPDGRNQWNHAGRHWTGISADPALYEAPGLTGWLTLRYRKLAAILAREGFDRVRMAITESGIDDVNPRPGEAGRKGWRDYDGTEWSRLPGIGDFAEQMAWYMRQVSRDPFIVGVVDFGFATIDPQWNSFDLLQRPDMLARVRQLQLGLPASSPAPIPAPQPPAVPQPPVVVEPPARPGDGQRYVAHTLRSGDTLWRLGGARWPELLRVLPMGDVRQLPVGAVVMIPEDLARERGLLP